MICHRVKIRVNSSFIPLYHFFTIFFFHNFFFTKKTQSQHFHPLNNRFRRSNLYEKPPQDVIYPENPIKNRCHRSIFRVNSSFIPSPTIFSQFFFIIFFFTKKHKASIFTLKSTDSAIHSYTNILPRVLFTLKINKNYISQIDIPGK
jgi:hypothetical protein